MVCACHRGWLRRDLRDRTSKPQNCRLRASRIDRGHRDNLLLPVTTFSQPINGYSIEKIPAMLKMNTWLSQHTRPTDIVLHSCCTTANAAVITNWMRENGVRVPPAPDSEIWFGDKTTIDNAVRGYIVIEKDEYQGAYLDYYASTDPAGTGRSIYE